MSLGRQIVPIRIDTDMLDAIDATVLRVNRVRAEFPFDRSSFIRRAIQDKLDHYARGLKAEAHYKAKPPPDRKHAAPVDVVGDPI